MSLKAAFSSPSSIWEKYFNQTSPRSPPYMAPDSLSKLFPIFPYISAVADDRVLAILKIQPRVLARKHRDQTWDFLAEIEISVYVYIYVPNTASYWFQKISIGHVGSHEFKPRRITAVDLPLKQKAVRYPPRVHWAKQQQTTTISFPVRHRNEKPSSSSSLSFSSVKS